MADSGLSHEELLEGDLCWRECNAGVFVKRGEVVDLAAVARAIEFDAYETDVRGGKRIEDRAPCLASLSSLRASRRRR